MFQRRAKLPKFAFQGLGTECADEEEMHQAKFTNERYHVGGEVLLKQGGLIRAEFLKQGVGWLIRTGFC